MGLFDSIMHKIFHAAAPASAESASPGGPAASAAAAPSAPASPAPAQAAASNASSASQGASPAGDAPSTAGQPVDVSAVLTHMAAQKGGGGNWQSSIVDLLKLLDLDSSLSARKQLAQELDVHAGEDGSAEQNIALQKAVMRKLAENGGKVPDSLKG